MAGASNRCSHPDSDSDVNKILILGATSAIAEAVARRFAKDGASLALIARNGERLASLAADLNIRGAQTVWTATLDVNDIAQHAATLEAAYKALGGIDAFLIAPGTLTDQKRAEADTAYALAELHTNFTSLAAFINDAARLLERQGQGTLAVISSVAGDRGRQSNYFYGAAKAGLDALLSGLRNRFTPLGIAVLTIKPGFVDTPMTANFKKGALWAQPDRVAGDIVAAMKRGKAVLYTPWFWALIMLIIRSIPEFVFRKLKL